MPPISVISVSPSARNRGGFIPAPTPGGVPVSLPAEHFALHDRGAIAPGLRADLVLLEADPTVDIGATRALRAVWIGGARVVDPSA